MRIAFLFNERPDQVWHAASIASELASLSADIDVRIVCCGTAPAETARSIVEAWDGKKPEIVEIQAPRLFAVLESLIGGRIALEKFMLLRFGLRCLRDSDALVVPDLTSLELQGRLPGTRMIFANHGAGDRARGFDPRIARFDFVLVAGRKLERRFLEHELIRPGHYAVTGYCKFDAVERVHPNPPKLFENDRPVILYNPHFVPELSSWQPWGVQVLDCLCRLLDRYNVIFAPHLKLFAKAGRFGARLPDRFLGVPGLHVDLGSAASGDMSYTRAADLYLGDVSSQVYELLRVPRPCVFLDPNGVDWRDDPDYAHWHFGEVLTDLDALPDALKRAWTGHAHYLPAQRQAVADTFDFSDRPASYRAARAILDYLDEPAR